MDYSPEYIKMCRRAEEIQSIADNYHDQFSISCWYSPNHVQCKGHFSDWHMSYKYCPVCRKGLKMTPEYIICHRMEGDKTTWLPRQDQLQVLSKLTWQEFDKECSKYDVDTKEQAGIQVVKNILTRPSGNAMREEK